jgi:hypothetical protein
VDVAVPSPTSVELRWSRDPGGETCIDQAELSERVEATIGRQVFANAEGVDTFVQGFIGPDALGHGWVAVVESRRGDTQPLRRELALGSSDCRRFDEAIVLVVALLVDATLPNARPLIITSKPPWASVSVGPDLIVASGMLPGLDVGFGLATGITLRPLWPAELSVHTWQTSDAFPGGGGRSGGQIYAWTAGVAVCPQALARDRWQLFGCAGGRGGGLYSNGVGLDVVRANTRTHVQFELRVGLRLRIAGPLFFRLELGGAVPLVRYAYAFKQADGTPQQVFRMAEVITLGEVGLEVRAP